MRGMDLSARLGDSCLEAAAEAAAAHPGDLHLAPSFQLLSRPESSRSHDITRIAKA
jgi:hypothetical protein